MADIGAVAARFFEACETGKGWAACAAFCLPDATFTSQAEPLADIHTVSGYTAWLAGLLAGPVPDGRYEIKAFAHDPERNCITVVATFLGANTGPGGPVPPTGRHVETDYVYAIWFQGDRIAHMSKVWNAGWAMRQLGWG